MIEFVVIGIRYNKWKNTVWKGQIVPLEIERSNIPKYENRSVVKIYGKVLGLLPKQQEKLPIGSSAFANLWTYSNYVKITLVDKPMSWLASFADDSNRYFCSDFLNSIDIWDYEDEDDYLCIFLDRKSTPSRFHEWLIRVGIDENSVNETVVRRYIKFRYWLDEIYKLSENDYGDDELQKYKEYCYKEYCVKQEELIKEQEEAEDRLSYWEFESNRISTEYGEGAWVDEYGAVFNDDGEWIGMD